MEWSRRHFARILEDGRRAGVVDPDPRLREARPAAAISRGCASVEIKPLRNRPKSTCESVESMRMTSERVVISSEKIATFLP